MENHGAVGVVERIIKTLKRKLAVMKIDKTNTPYKLASDVAEIIKTLMITPHSVTKVSPFEAHMGRKPNTLLSNVATSSSPNNLIWESSKHACLDRKNLTKPALPRSIARFTTVVRRPSLYQKERAEIPNASEPNKHRPPDTTRHRCKIKNYRNSKG